jgi:integrase
MPTKTTDNWDTLVDDWIAAARTGGTTVSTRKKYRGPVEREFLPWLREQGVSDPHAIDSRLMTRYGAHLLDTPNRVTGEARSGGTIRSYVTSTNLFVAWLKEAGEMDVKVAGRRPPMPPKKRKDTLSVQEYRALLAEAEKQGNQRDALILRALWETGARADEIGSVKGSSLVKIEGDAHLEVVGKTFRYTGPRPVPVSHELFRDLKEYAARKRVGPDSPLFVGKIRSKKTGDYEGLTSNGVAQMIANLCFEIDGRLRDEGRGSFRRVGPQRFRRAFASRMSRHMNQGELAQIMGTSSKVLDEFYIDRSPRDIHRAAMAAMAAAAAADND